MLRPGRVSTSSGKKSVSHQLFCDKKCMSVGGCVYAGSCLCDRRLPHRRPGSSTRSCLLWVEADECKLGVRNFPVTPPQYFSKSTAVQMGGVLPYKWEAYCSTNGRRVAGFPFLRSLEARQARRYKWGAYCRTNWRCTVVLFRQVVGVGASETLPIGGLCSS